MQQLDLKINELPVPTWNRLKLNDSTAKVSIPDAEGDTRVAVEGSICINKSTGVETSCGGCAGGTCFCPVHGVEFVRIPTGMGEEVNRLATRPPLRLVASEGRSLAAITIRYQDDVKACNRIELEAKAGSEVTLVMTYIANTKAQGEATVQTRIAAAAGAKVKLVQVQLLGDAFTHLNDVGSVLEQGASLESVQLQLGAKEIYNGVRTELTGEGADFNAAIGYYGRNGQRLDMNFIANHYGKKTTTEMTADGVLQEGAFKIYRGTIDFKNGCAGSVGAEDEAVLLLSDDVVNQSIPLILCSEEDVQGTHGASIGKLDEDLLFYLCSRGFSEQEAINMMAKAKIEKLCRKIPDEETVQLVERYLEGVIAKDE